MRPKWESAVNTRQSLTWIHFGDLHMTEAGEENHRDFLSLIDEVNTHLAEQVDFCVLPGDNANNGTVAQYQLIRRALDALRCPIHIIPGDHDREPGDLQAFYSVLKAEPLPTALSLNGYQCLFLDVVSAGSGGPDFRLSLSDLKWMEAKLRQTATLDERAILFMHTYPADLKSCAGRLLDVIRQYPVLAVDIGHTHYNELSNDGRTIYAATRSTGQIEEGPVGFSIMHLERDVVSWRFKPLGSPWPLVMITSPADARLRTDRSELKFDQNLRQITARAWSAVGIRACRYRADEGPWIAMDSDGDSSRWTAPSPPTQIPRVLTVQAEDAAGHIGVESIDVAPIERARVADGSDADTIGPWPDKHILGTQLGPNRNGRHW